MQAVIGAKDDAKRKKLEAAFHTVQRTAYIETMLSSLEE
jgi:hypothetical protein